MRKRREPKMRGALARLFLKVPGMRGLYVRALLRSLEQGGTKKRPLPPELRDLKRLLDRLPEKERKKALEQTLRNPNYEPPNRSLRRASAKQSKQARRRRR